MERICANCALKAIKGGMCPIFNANMEEEKGCPIFTTEVRTCNICGNVILQGDVLQYDDDHNGYALLCNVCANADPCATCRYINTCRFQNDNECTEPPYETVQIRQGNATIQTQRMNPKRVQATCAQGCSCFNEDGLDDGTFCIKTNNCGCKNYKLNWR